MPVSFGYGIGDILIVGKLVWDVYSAYKDAPEQFRNFSHEILSLHIVIRKIEDQLGISSSDGIGSGSQLPVVVGLSTRDKDDLKILYDGLQAIMKELDDLLSKYRKLESSCNPIDRFKWGQEDLVGFRDKIRSHIILLTAFNATLANCQLAHQSTQLGQQNVNLIRLQEQMEQLLGAGRLHRRASVASLRSIATFALSIGQKEAWKELCRDLHLNGITLTADMIKTKKEELCKLFRTASTLSSSGEPDEGVPVPQGPKGRARPMMAWVKDYLAAQLGGSLHRAAFQGRTDVVQELLDKGANIDDRRSGYTALHCAAVEGHLEVVKVLLDRGAGIVNTLGSCMTALHLAAQSRGTEIEIVKLLLERGASVDAADVWGNTPLHYAAGLTELLQLVINPQHNRHAEILIFLLENGARPDVKSSFGRTPLGIARQLGWERGVKLLTEHIANNPELVP